MCLVPLGWCIDLPLTYIQNWDGGPFVMKYFYFCRSTTRKMCINIYDNGFMETKKFTADVTDAVDLLPAATKLGQGNVFTGVCDSVHRGGVSASVHPGIHIPPGSRPPRSRHPPGADTPQEQTPFPPGADPPRGRTPSPPREQTPLEQTPPAADPPRSRPPRQQTHTPLPPPPGRWLRHTVNERSYWNAFLFFIRFSSDLHVVIGH